MKMFRITALIAMTSTALFPIAASAATVLLDPIPGPDPDGLSVTNLATAQAQCNAAAAAADTDGPGALSDIFTAEVVETAPVLKSGPTEIGTHSLADAIGGYSPAADATFTPASLQIEGDPYRIGGSVNMFGLQKSVGGYYSASQYDFRADFKTTYTVAYTCTISMEDFIPGHGIIHHPAVGIYVIAGDFGDSEDAIRGNCAAFTAQGQDPTSLPDWWGDLYHGGNPDNPHCMFQGTAAYDEPAVPDSWADPVVVATGVPGGSFDQDQINNLLAHETHGEGYFDAATVYTGQVVVCISPTTSTQTKKGAPGTWVLKNGYIGDKCNTAWYNGTTPYSTLNYAGTSTPNLNDGSHNFVTVPVI